MKLTNKGVIGTTEIVAIAIAILMIAIVLPIALSQIGGTAGMVNHPYDNALVSENWGVSRSVLVTILATVVPILAVLGIAMKFL